MRSGLSEAVEADERRGAARSPTLAERAAMGRDGYVTVAGFFDQAETAELLRWTEEITAAPEVPGRHMVYYEDSLVEQGRRVVQRIENFCPFHVGFDAMIRHGALARSRAGQRR